MHDYSTWKERVESVTSLLLDDQNPRIPEITPDLSQRDIAEQLVLHDDVYGLAKSIVEKGYYPTEVLIAVKEEDELVVIEGNRRLAALKLLISPELAPAQYEDRFRLLRAKVPLESIKRVRVTFAPSRELAAPLIIERHTHIAIKQWKPAQQAKYLASLVGPGLSIADVAEQFGIDKGDLEKNLRAHTMYQIACTLPLDAETLERVRNPRTFNLSALERLVENSDAADFLGVQFEEGGKFSGHIAQKEFIKGYRRIVKDIANNDENTRTLNNARDITKYLKRFGKDKPDLSKSGKFTSEELLGKQQAAEPRRPIPRKQTGPRPNPSLVPRNFKCMLQNARINEILKELRNLRVADYENATAVMFRIFAELVIGFHLDTTKKIRPLLVKARKDGKPNDWTPPLRHMLQLLLTDPEIELSTSARKSLNRAVSNDLHPLSLDSLDQFVHNRYEAPGEKELRRFWDMFEELLAQLVIEKPTETD
jgi:hypothetical protein